MRSVEKFSFKSLSSLILVPEFLCLEPKSIVTIWKKKLPLSLHTKIYAIMRESSSVVDAISYVTRSRE